MPRVHPGLERCVQRIETEFPNEETVLGIEVRERIFIAPARRADHDIAILPLEKRHLNT